LLSKLKKFLKYFRSPNVFHAKEANHVSRNKNSVQPALAGKVSATREQELVRVVETHRGRLLSMIGNRIRDQVEAEDVLQEVFEEYVESYDLGTAIESLGAWLVTVAQNKVLDRFRRKKTQNAHRESVLQESEGLEIASPDRPDEDWSRSILRKEIMEALSQLPEEQYDVFVKHELEGQSFEDISAETGVSVNTLLSRKRYAVMSLREFLKEVYDELE
jgi:RNA polymerase sigma factor (sigma-70 family)